MSSQNELKKEIEAAQQRLEQAQQDLDEHKDYFTHLNKEYKLPMLLLIPAFMIGWQLGKPEIRKNLPKITKVANYGLIALLKKAIHLSL